MKTTMTKDDKIQLLLDNIEENFVEILERLARLENRTEQKKLKREKTAEEIFEQVLRYALHRFYKHSDSGIRKSLNTNDINTIELMLANGSSK